MSLTLYGQREMRGEYFFSVSEEYLSNSIIKNPFRNYLCILADDILSYGFLFVNNPKTEQNGNIRFDGKRKTPRRSLFKARRRSEDRNQIRAQTRKTGMNIPYKKEGTATKRRPRFLRFKIRSSLFAGTPTRGVSVRSFPRGR